MSKAISKRLQAPVGVKLDDDKAERVRRSHDERIKELQHVPVVMGRLFQVQLEEGKETPIAHRLGRRAVALPSAPRGGAVAGNLSEIISDRYDPREFTVLRADNWMATVTVDVWIF